MLFSSGKKLFVFFVCVGCLLVFTKGSFAEDKSETDQNKGGEVVYQACLPGSVYNVSLSRGGRFIMQDCFHFEMDGTFFKQSHTCSASTYLMCNDIAGIKCYFTAQLLFPGTTLIVDGTVSADCQSIEGTVLDAARNRVFDFTGVKSVNCTLGQTGIDTCD